MQYLYILKNNKRNIFKIGITNNPTERFKTLRKKTPFTFDVMAIIQLSERSDIFELEQQAHKICDEYRCIHQWKLKGEKSFEGWTEWFGDSQLTTGYIRGLLIDFLESAYIKDGFHRDIKSRLPTTPDDLSCEEELQKQDYDHSEYELKEQDLEYEKYIN